MADGESNEEKTEAATPRRRQEAREQGQVAMSQELIGALLLLACLLALAVGGGAIVTQIGGVLHRSLELVGERGPSELSLGDAAELLGALGFSATTLIAFFVVPLLAIGLLIAYGQVGFQITPKAIGFKLEKLDPLKGFKRLFGLRNLVRTGTGLVKVTLVAIAMGVAVWTQIEEIASLSALELLPALAAVGHVTLRCVAAALGAILALAILDFVYQRWQHERDMRMSKQEVRQELKMTEGDPHLKSRIRRMQRELASRRMMQDVPKATVIVTNPTHYAIALRYEREGEAKARNAGRAPRVVAKGVDHVAQRIKEVAREAGVVCYEDVALARALHARCEIGDEIPVELYQAVAGVLAYVYRIQGKRAAAVA